MRRDLARQAEIVRDEANREAAGFPVVRFTGSEIFKDANDCVQQLREALFSPMERVAKAAGLLK